MPVAKTYAKCEIEGEVFIENKRAYVNVKTAKGLKKVRWYSDAEYKRMYPDAVIEPQDIMMTFNARHAFGFDDAGYITLYRGDEKVLEDWAQTSWPPRAWRNETFGFYTPAKLFPGAPPKGITPVKLTWDEVKQDDIHMKSHEEVKRYVDTLLYGTDTPQTHKWDINEWIEKEVTIREKSTDESRFGTKHTYTMSDAENNTYIWTTGAKDFGLDVVVHLKMKVKEYKDNAVVVWYCKEI